MGCRRRRAGGGARLYRRRSCPISPRNDLLGGGTPAEVRARLRAATRTRGCARRRRSCPGEHAGERRGEARGLRDARRAWRRRRGAGAARPRRSCPRPSPRAGRPRALPRRPSDQSALSHPGGRGRARALDEPGGGRRARATSCVAAGHAPIVMKREIDGFVMNRLQGALLRGGLPAGRRRLCQRRGRRYRHPRGARAALVVHGAVRDHRPQRARRRPRLRRALPGHLRAAASEPAAARRLGRAR